MNFVPFVLENGAARVGDAEIFLGDRLAWVAGTATGELKLGIRPLYLEVHGKKVDQGVEARVKSVEDQGSFKILTAIMGDHLVRARLAEDEPVPAETAWLRFPTDWIRLFSDDRLL